MEENPADNIVCTVRECPGFGIAHRPLDAEPKIAIINGYVLLENLILSPARTRDLVMDLMTVADDAEGGPVLDGKKYLADRQAGMTKIEARKAQHHKGEEE